MAARDLPIKAEALQKPIGRITIDDQFEEFAQNGISFVLMPVLVSLSGHREKTVIAFTIRPVETESPSVHVAAMIAPNHPVNKTTIMGDNQVVKEV